MIRILRYLGFFLLGIISALLIAWWILDEELPEGVTGPEADALARAMLTAVNQPAWDSIPIIQWTFKNQHQFQWDKTNHLCLVKWDQYRVHLDINKAAGIAYSENIQLNAPEADEVIKQAWDYFNNDSFWLNGVVKAFDDGTSRSKVHLKNGSTALKVHYQSGGTTPGDSYLWILDENFRPTACKMWVQILPIGGMNFTWEDWVTLPGGAQVATVHKFMGGALQISDLKVAHNWSDLGYDENPLKVLMP